MRRITNGFGHEITDFEWLAENLFNYVPFEIAAPQIDPMWGRQHLRKELVHNRVYLSDILVVEDDQLYTDFSQNKKFFISKEEVQRLKEDVAKRTKRNEKRCEWCNRVLRYCEKKPCDRRLVTKPAFRQSVETVNRFFTRHIEAAAKRKRRFTTLDKDGREKDFKHR